jgi:hypothetical protein
MDYDYIFSAPKIAPIEIGAKGKMGLLALA